MEKSLFQGFYRDFIYEIPEVRVKIQVKAVVLGILLHAERKSNLRVIFCGE